MIVPLTSLDGRDGQGNIDEPSVFSTTHGLIMIDALALAGDEREWSFPRRGVREE